VAKLLYFRRPVWINAKSLCLPHGLVKLLLDQGLIRRSILLERLLNLRKQVVVQKPDDLVPLLVHDPIDAEVQVGLIQLEKLLEQAAEFLKVCRHVDPSSCLYVARRPATES